MEITFNKNKRQKIFVTVFMCMFACLLSASALHSEMEANTVKNSKDESVKFIKNLVDTCLEIVNDDSLSHVEKRHKLSEYVNKFLDIDRTARAVFARLGYKNLSPAEQEKVKKYLKQYLLHFYAGEGKLSAMTDAELTRDPVAEIRGDNFAVTTLFTKNSSPATKIVWVTKNQKIYYIEIDDINQIITLRSEMHAAVGEGTLMDFINNHLEE
ncbi:MAG: ABC transporter substrate-binding protein [Alphaproteobacteria bacterium]